MVELARGGGERAFRGEGADVQFIEHDVVPRPAPPVLAPAIGLMVDRLARPVHVLRLEPGRRIGNARPVGELKAIEVARPDPLDEDSKKPPSRRSIGIAAPRLSSARARRFCAGAQSRKRTPSSSNEGPWVQRAFSASASSSVCFSVIFRCG